MVKRYRHHGYGELYEEEGGEFVTFADYADLLSLAQALNFYAPLGMQSRLMLLIEADIPYSQSDRGAADG